MDIWIAIVIIWAAAILGCVFMKKIQAEDIIYPVWAVFIAIIFTVFALWYSTVR